MTSIAAGPILLAEDNLVNQRVTIAMLERLGFHVDVVADGVDAVNAAAETEYQAILMNCQLPEMDGFQAAAQIRRYRGASRSTPIIAVTSANKDTDHQRCISAGMDDYLPKPITRRGLADMLTRWAPATSWPSTDDVVPVLATLDGETLDPEIVTRLERLGAAAGEDLMGQLTILYLADSDERLVELRSGLAARDASAIYRSAHTLTGASANIGATTLARLCATLAVKGKTSDFGDIDTVFESVEAELLRVRSTLQSRSTTP